MNFLGGKGKEGDGRKVRLRTQVTKNMREEIVRNKMKERNRQE